MEPILSHITTIITIKFKIFHQTCFSECMKKTPQKLDRNISSQFQMNIIWKDILIIGKIRPKIRIFDGLQEVVSRLSSGVRGRVSTLNLSTHPENAFSGL